MSAVAVDARLPACVDVARQLLQCAEASPCVAERGGGVVACLRAGEAPLCDVQRRLYFECRRAQLDMRTRIQGKKWADVS